MNSNRSSQFTVIATLSLVIFLLGMLGVLVINASDLNDHIKDNIEVTVFFNTELQDDRAKELSDSILQMDFASSGKFVSSDEAVFNFKNEIGDDFVEILGNNPLPASLGISIKATYADNISLLKLERELSQIGGVLEISYPQNVFQQIDKNRRIISFWLVILTILLVLIAIVLMVNTIRILIFSDRFIIKNQQLIGAKEAFIVRPYKRKALKWTFTSFIVGIVLLIAFVWMVFAWLDVSMDLNLHAIAGHFAQNWFQYILMLFLLLVSSMGVIYLATSIATKKYLRTHTDNLYN